MIYLVVGFIAGVVAGAGGLFTISLAAISAKADRDIEATRAGYDKQRVAEQLYRILHEAETDHRI